jgi:hypothetical protein
MSLIEIFFNVDKTNISTADFEIDNQKVQSIIDHEKIIINHDVSYGIHMLKCRLQNQDDILHIDKILIDSVNLDSFLYFSFIITSFNVIQNPATTLDGNNKIWNLPFGNPMSFWLDLAGKKINKRHYGHNLWQYYDIFYPEKITLSQHYPKLLRDFFQYDFDFFCREKNNKLLPIPTQQVSLSIDTELKEKSSEEIVLLQDWIFENRFSSNYEKTAVETYNTKENQVWHVLKLYDNEQWLPAVDKLPATLRLIESIGLKQFVKINLTILPPKSFIAPHYDSPINSIDLATQHTLYIPVKWEDGNYFKYSGMPITKDSAPTLQTNFSCYHSVVNDSNEIRAVIIVYLDIEHNFHLIANNV